MCSLRLDWCGYAAALYAAEHWHYSKCLSAGKNVYVGVWEDAAFVGAIVFGLGSGNVTNGLHYGLARTNEMAELTRIALRGHRAPVSRMVAIALRLLKRQSPGLRLVISLADPRQGHHGGVYQAGGWVYTGETKPDVEYFSGGAWVHHRTATSRGSAAGLPARKLPPKHRYLMPLDVEIRGRIAQLARPYPKRPRAASADGGTAGDQPVRGGSIPTAALHGGI